MFKSTPTKWHFNRTQLFSYSLFALSIAILAASFMLTTNVTVIKNWTLRVPASELHAGDTVTLVSEYTKVRDVTGKSIRYIECKNDQHVYIRYPLNEAVANRASGTGGTGIVVKVPDNIPNVPTTCKFTVAITYDVYPWKKVNVSQSSDEFQLLPKRDEPQEVSFVDPHSSNAQSNPSPTVATVRGQSSQVSYSSPNSTPAVQPAQSKTPQTPQTTQAQPDGTPTKDTVTLSPTPVQPAQPSLLQKTLCTATLGLLC